MSYLESGRLANVENTSRWCSASRLAWRESRGPLPPDVPSPSVSLRHILFLLPQSLHSRPSLPFLIPRLSLTISFPTSHLLRPPPSPATSFCLSKQLLQHVGPTYEAGANGARRPPSPQTVLLSWGGEAGDRALPSDYTGGLGLEYSPEGRQLSISDNC